MENFNEISAIKFEADLSDNVLHVFIQMLFCIMLFTYCFFLNPILLKLIVACRWHVNIVREGTDSNV